MMQYQCRDSFYKTPFGAAVRGSRVRFRITTRRICILTKRS